MIYSLFVCFLCVIIICLCIPFKYNMWIDCLFISSIVLGLCAGLQIKVYCCICRIIVCGKGNKKKYIKKLSRTKKIPYLKHFLHKAWMPWLYSFLIITISTNTNQAVKVTVKDFFLKQN